MTSCLFPLAYPFKNVFYKYRKNFLLDKLTPIEKKGKTENGRIASAESEPIYLNPLYTVVVVVFPFS